MSYDYPEPEFLAVRQQRSRRLRYCCECRGPILAGEIYEHTAGRWEGDFSSFTTCLPCAAFRDLVEEPYYGGLDECLRNDGDAPTYANWTDHLADAKRRRAAHEPDDGRLTGLED